eukprot:NODE_4779_length_553_cov_91.916667_g3492_i0.p4 GENE.NODE_4779_length_553_cov_91.916667_g3492_i0~~NODE_4779_length_553_cov_91.916667_g3492_i0.p4  ORF type:complete len:94 (+),score=0.70 NODE_4779_length_553_cov_91.916667_g3492_i0:174-455(+)
MCPIRAVVLRRAALRCVDRSVPRPRVRPRFGQPFPPARGIGWVAYHWVVAPTRHPLYATPRGAAPPHADMQLPAPPVVSPACLLTAYFLSVRC